ncbi:class I SAM-dependent methyltransferase [Pseudomarimonas salicorniae]|uniref:Class I SAM-dependent methyltransferase n=1 Tax=Pseudomarimonas salicorniae TaxID=2933270 RepID=A0ABT0GC82_9GAMM|nr:class I SAM-dependent methyltransferase [Lysobacter sp. CAU 1642]MCK7592130.1 class I SAM-dependent methyltransferase [Lysobacter sp. CAU 1642]
MSTIPPPGPTLPSAREARVDSWSSYWRGGALHSCAGSFSGNYAGSLREFWEARFAQLPDAARVLDACCGNAPLSQLLCAHEAFRERGAQIDAVDLAEIAPPWIAAMPAGERGRLQVHARVDVELLPFDEGSFDFCMSQFGVEYAGAAALAELRRVLRPEGVFAALVHHIDALPVRIAREELTHAEWIEAQGLPEIVARLIEPMARSATAEGQQALRRDAAANDLRARFNGILEQMQQRIEGALFPDLLAETRDGLMAVLQRARLAGVEAADNALGHWRQEHARSLLRQRELIEHARDREALETWLEPMAGKDREVRPISFANGELAGWAVVVGGRPG